MYGCLDIYRLLGSGYWINVINRGRISEYDMYIYKAVQK